MVKKGLATKIVATFTLIVAVTFIVISTILSFWFENYYFHQRDNQLKQQVSLINSKVKEYRTTFAQVQYNKLQETLTFVGTYLNADIVIVDVRGISYASSKEEYNDKTVNLLGTDLEKLRNGEFVENKEVYSDIYNENVHMYATSVTENDMFVGGIVIFSPASQINEPLREVYRIIWIICVSAVVISSFIINFFSRKIITEPLSQINQATKRIAKGDVERRVYLDTGDEISELAESFNIMADSLEKVERGRREFISNVSHELRTPITSIKGFIGGVLDGVIPKDRENYYLNIAYEEIQRLTRLVNDLLDLSAIEAGQFTLNIGQVDINEIIRLCVIRFETKIKEKKLNVDVFLQDEHVFVRGDRDRLNQVVTNLLDNAIKYGNEHGNIKIHTKVKGDRVVVSIYNDGEVISEQDKTRIWDRFYKSDKSRTNKVSTGLGLSIVRNILTQLGEDIWIENGEKTGVTFHFTLKKA